MPYPALALTLLAFASPGPREQEGRTRVRVAEPPTPSVQLDLAERRQVERLERARKAFPAVTVIVEGRPLEVPEPPADAKLAASRWNTVGAEAQEAIKALSAELEIQYKAQDAAVARLKSHPEEGVAGQGSELHHRIWSLLKDEAIRKEERDLREGTATVLERMTKREEGDQWKLEYATRSSGPVSSSFKGDAPPILDWEIAREHRTAPGRAIRAFEGSTFLKEYAPVWQAYSPRLRSYLLEASGVLGEAEGVKEQLATDILTRALRIQFMERVKALVAFNQRIWALGANHAVEPQWFHTASRTTYVPPGGYVFPIEN